MKRLVAILKFQIERWIQRGALHQILFVAALIVVISVAGGVVAWLASDQFKTPFDAIWWSFLRLTDPGYLGDDEGALLRVVSTVVTVLGYVLFMGSLIAIMTQWLARTLNQFESGLAPISMRGHVVILGWTNRTPEIVRQLLAARGRLRRFLEVHDQRSLRIVVVADEVSAERRHRLRALVGERWRDRQIFLRTGSPLKPGDLQRFDLLRAAAIIVPGDELRYGGTEMSDARVLKTLLNLRPILDPLPEEERPTIVAEIIDPRKERAAYRTHTPRLEIVPGDAVIARILAQMIRDRHLAKVFLELLSHRRGCAPYVRPFPELAGQHPVAVDGRFERATVIGALRREEERFVSVLNPPAEFRLEPDDMLVLVARSFEDCVMTREAAAEAPPARVIRSASVPSTERRVLVLGWSHKIGVMLEELGRDESNRIRLTLVSRAPQAVRERVLEEYRWDPARLKLEHLEADYAVSGVLDDFDLPSFDRIMLLASTSEESADTADARTVLGYELMKSLLDEQISPGVRSPEIIVELVHPASSRLFRDPQDVVLVSPKILGHLQTHVALRPELNSVFGEIFAPGGVEVALRHGEDYGLTGGSVTYRDLERHAVSHGEIALGLLVAQGTRGETLELCPPSDREWSGDKDGSIIVLAAGEREREEKRKPRPGGEAPPP